MSFRYLSNMAISADGEHAFDLVVVHSYSRFFRDASSLEFYVRKLAKITPCNVNDGRAGGDASLDNPGEVYADSAYRGPRFAGAVKATGGVPRVAATGIWGRDEEEALAKLRSWNKVIQRVGCRIEKIFGTWKHSDIPIRKAYIGAVVDRVVVDEHARCPLSGGRMRLSTASCTKTTSAPGFIVLYADGVPDRIKLRTTMSLKWRYNLCIHRESGGYNAKVAARCGPRRSHLNALYAV
jgi:hypothetical protein